MKLDIEVIQGRDLVVEFSCDCPSDTFKDSPIAHLMKHKIKLYGYNDSNFFDNVNKEPRTMTCKCGKVYQYQWKREHVLIKKVGVKT